MKRFKPNIAFRKDYNRLFREDPHAANLFILLAEMGNKKGQVVTNEQEELAVLMAARFNDPGEYAL